MTDPSLEYLIEKTRRGQEWTDDEWRAYAQHYRRLVLWRYVHALGFALALGLVVWLLGLQR